jgi:AcrR family transcriptional regulator
MPDLADKRKAALDELTREEICTAATRVISEHGMVGMTMSMVADEAGLAKGTLYNYFQDKNDLIFHVLLKAFEPMADRMEEIADADVPPAEQLARAATAILGSLAGHQHLITMAVQSRTTVDPVRAMPAMMKMRTRLERAFTRVVKRGMDQGSFRAGDPAGIGRLFLATINGLIHPRIFVAPERSVEDEVRELMDVFLNGIATRPDGTR